MKFTELIGFAMSVASALATAYFWLVKARGERPRLQAHLLNRIGWDPNRLAMSQYRFWGVRVLVTNLSSLPNTLLKVGASVQLRDGSWLKADVGVVEGGLPAHLTPMHSAEFELNAAFALPGTPPELPDYSANPDFYGNDSDAYSKAREAHAEAVRSHAVGRLASPVRLRVELKALDGRRFETVLTNEDE